MDIPTEWGLSLGTLQFYLPDLETRPFCIEILVVLSLMSKNQSVISKRYAGWSGLLTSSNCVLEEMTTKWWYGIRGLRVRFWSFRIMWLRSKLWLGLPTSTGSWLQVEEPLTGISDLETPSQVKQSKLLTQVLKSATLLSPRQSTSSSVPTVTLSTRSTCGNTQRCKKWALWWVTLWEYCIWQWAQMGVRSWLAQVMKLYDSGVLFQAIVTNGVGWVSWQCKQSISVDSHKWYVLYLLLFFLLSFS